MEKVVRHTDFLSGLFLLLFSIVLIIVTPAQVPLYDASDALSPRLVPYITLTLIGAIGVIMIFNVLLFSRKSVNIKDDVEHEKESTEIALERNFKDLIIFISISVFIIVFAESIGFTFASIIGLIIGLIAFGAKSWVKIIAVSISVPLIIEVGYRFLGIYLPLGFWEDIVYSIF